MTASGQPAVCGDIDPESGLTCGRTRHYGFHRHVFPDGRGHHSWCEGTSWFTPHDDPAPANTTAACPAATWAGLTVCVTCPTPEAGTACAREPGALLRAASCSPGRPQIEPNNTTPADRIRAAITDAVQICNGPLIDHAATGVLYALGMVTVPPADGAPAPACGEECAEGHVYAGRCALHDPTACVWPDCLSDGQQAELAEQVRRSALGEPTTPMPDQRQVCGCTDNAPDIPAANSGPEIANPQASAATAGDIEPDNPAASDDAVDNLPWRWAETIGAHGTGNTRTVDIDIQQGDGDHIPVEIPLADAVILHAMLGDAIREDEPCPVLVECTSEPEQVGTAAGDDGLREQLAAAIRAWADSGSVYPDDLTTIVLGVIQPHIRALGSEVARLEADLAAETALRRERSDLYDTWRDKANELGDQVRRVTTECDAIEREQQVGQEGRAIEHTIRRIRRALDGAADTTPPAEPRCPRCGDSLADYPDDELVYHVGDQRPYCSGECVVRAHREALKEPVDTCRPVQVGGETIRVHGARPLTEQEQGYVAEVVAAARRKLIAEPPVVPDDDGTESEQTRRIRAQQRGLILPAVEPSAGEPPVPCEACTRANSRGFTLDVLAHAGCADALADAASAEQHAYLSTGCLHGEHGYCQANTGSNGAKVPATCKFCAAPCVCPCHETAPEPGQA